MIDTQPNAVSLKKNNFFKLLEEAGHYFLVLMALASTISLTVTELSAFIAAFFSIVSGAFFRDYKKLKSNMMVWGILFFLVWVGLSVSWSVAEFHYGLLTFHKYSKILLIPLLLPLCASKLWRDRALIVFLVGMTFTVILSYLKAMGILHWPHPSQPPSVVFYDHIETSFLVAFACYLFAFYAWTKPGWWMICLPLIVLFSYQEFFINEGRTGWVAYIALGALFSVQFLGWKKGLLFGGILILGLVVSFYFLSSNFSQIISTSKSDINQFKQGNIQTSLGYRLEFDSISWKLVKQKPVIGFGAGSYRVAAGLGSGWVSKWGQLNTPHNEYIMVLLETGIIGLLALLFIFAAQWWYVLKKSDMNYCAQAFLLAFMLSCLYNNFLFSAGSGYLYVLFSSLLSAF